MKKLLKPPIIGLILLTLVLSLGFALEATAIVGAPCTPVSVAGVARRKTRRVVVASSATAAPATTTTTTTAAAPATAPPPAQPAVTTTAPPPAHPAAAAPPPAGAPPVGSIVTTLPSGCVSAPKGGVEYYNCGGVYYRPTFQGNNLVYVVQQP